MLSSRSRTTRLSRGDRGGRGDNRAAVQVALAQRRRLRGPSRTLALGELAAQPGHVPQQRFHRLLHRPLPLGPSPCSTQPRTSPAAGLPGRDGGAPADFVVCDRDPVADLHMVDHPAQPVLGGRLAGS